MPITPGRKMCTGIMPTCTRLPGFITPGVLGPTILTLPFLLALAINSISSGQKQMELPFNIEPVKVLRLGSHITDLLRGVSDDSMRQFLVSVVQYLTQLPKTMTEIPIDIIRALRDVERIVKIEEEVLTKKEQDLLRFYILQMARLCGENG